MSFILCRVIFDYCKIVENNDHLIDQIIPITIEVTIVDHLNNHRKGVIER